MEDEKRVRQAKRVKGFRKTSKEDERFKNLGCDQVQRPNL
jgi:hypothetical protein